MQDPLAEVRMQTHPFPLLGVERAGPIPDAARHSDPSHIVDRGGTMDLAGISIGQGRSLGGQSRELSDAVRVTSEEGRLQVGEGAFSALVFLVLVALVVWGRVAHRRSPADLDA